MWRCDKIRSMFLVSGGGGGEGLVNAELIVGGGEVGHADQCYKRIDLLPGSSSVN